MKAAVKRTPSQLKHSQGAVAGSNSLKRGTEAGPTRIEAELEELRGKVRELEEGLQREQEQNRNLQNR